jgi:hypothetical protein
MHTIADTPTGQYANTDRWVADNVIADIMYLNSLMQSPDVSSERKTAAQNEQKITVPHGDPGAQTALCNGKTYWASLETSPTQAVCQENGVIAIADYTDPNSAGEMRYLSHAPTALS